MQRGDRILSLDGAPVAGWELERIAKALARSGPHDLLLRRGGEAVTVRLQSRPLNLLFAGHSLGLRLEQRDGQLVVAELAAGGPAEEAGVRPGDRVLEIDGESAADLDLDAAHQRIKGRAGCRSRLVLEHDGEQRRVQLECRLLRM